MRVAILGNSGSGKSTLARWLSAYAGTESLDLDTVAWEPNKIAVARAPEDAAAEVRRFCSARQSWVVEGCYASLIRQALGFGPRLLFLNPGLEQCVNYCRSRPWEPHKYQSQEVQNQYLEPLLAWVAAYYTREGDVSLAAHEECYGAYDGPKEVVTGAVQLDPPPAAVLSWIL
jgi:adenylate kinase family enzyme